MKYPEMYCFNACILVVLKSLRKTVPNVPRKKGTDISIGNTSEVTNHWNFHGFLSLIFQGCETQILVRFEEFITNLHWLVVSTHLKNISQIGSCPQVGVKIKNVWNHHLVHHIPEKWNLRRIFGKYFYYPGAWSNLPPLALMISLFHRSKSHEETPPTSPAMRRASKVEGSEDSNLKSWLVTIQCHLKWQANHTLRIHVYMYIYIYVCVYGMFTLHLVDF